MRKSLLILLLLFILRVIVSCTCNCPEKEFIDFNCSIVQLEIRDNSGAYEVHADTTQILPAEAIGFHFWLYDTLEMNYYYAQNAVFNFGFNTASAFSCDCDFYDYKQVKQLNNIEVITRLNFSDEYPSGSNVSNLFLGRINNWGMNELYKTPCDIIDYYQLNEVLDNPSISFSLYLTEAAKNDSLQLEFLFHFNNNTYLSKVSPVLSINDITWQLWD